MSQQDSAAIKHDRATKDKTMRITRIKYSADNRKFSPMELNTIMQSILSRLAKAGYVTEGAVINSQSIKIGQHMRSFSIDTNIHDRNLYVSRCGNKLTNLPTWDQRVEFNDIINNTLSQFEVSANIKSGPYTIRIGTESMTESDWYDQRPDWQQDCIESVDEKQYLEERRLARNEANRIKRAEARVQSRRAQIKAV